VSALPTTACFILYGQAAGDAGDVGQKKYITHYGGRRALPLSLQRANNSHTLCAAHPLPPNIFYDILARFLKTVFLDQHKKRHSMFYVDKF
jgi:hypothetical protein